MPSEEALTLANHYLQRYSVSAEKFGFGPFLDRGSIKLMASNRSHFDGSMAVLVTSGIYLDCGAIAEEMFLDMRSRHPELQPHIMGYRGHASHFWVEITDPVTKELIQIDGTPWHCSLNPGHVGSPMGDAVVRPQKTALFSSSGLPFSVKAVGDKTIRIYLMGSLPAISFEAQRQKILARDASESPDYAFKFQVVEEKGYLGMSFKRVSISNVLLSNKSSIFVHQWLSMVVYVYKCILLAKEFLHRALEDFC